VPYKINKKRVYIFLKPYSTFLNIIESYMDFMDCYKIS